ncbi:MAG: antitoxin [Candidatus Diapherotrites archaeon]|nr:antitoxin [Candidatus Diapherotrites archaeon]
MAVKTITIREDAYRLLKSVKKPDESFSDVIIRILGKKRSGKDVLKELSGLYGIDEDAIRKIRELDRKWNPPQW